MIKLFSFRLVSKAQLNLWNAFTECNIHVIIFYPGENEKSDSLHSCIDKNAGMSDTTCVNFSLKLPRV